MKRDKKIFKSTIWIVVSVLCLFFISACSADHSPKENDNTVSAEFVYPDKSDFLFETDKDTVTVKNGENIVIKCTLKNTSDRDYYIEHGAESITYSYNDSGEVINTIAVLDEFKSNSQISRTLNIAAKDSGKITVSAAFSVKPSQYSEEFKTYAFEKNVQVNVPE